MNKSYTLLVALFLGFQGFSQTPVISFYTSDHNLTDITNGGDTIEGDGSAWTISDNYYTVMTGVDSVFVGCKRTEVQIINGTADYFCWKECYIPEPAGSRPVWYATDSLMMYDGDTVKLYSVYLDPDGNKGVAIYDYVFTPKGFETDTVAIEIIFGIFTVGVEENKLVEVAIYPNPTSDYVQIDVSDELNSPINANIVSVSGQKMGEYKIIKNKKIDVSSFSPGMYVIELSNKNGLLTRKSLTIK